MACRFVASCVGSCPAVLTLVIRQPLFGLEQPSLGVCQLGFQKLVRAFRLVLPVAQILFDVKRRQTLSHFLSNTGITAHIAEAKRFLSYERRAL